MKNWADLFNHWSSCMQFNYGKFVDKRSENVVNRVQKHINVLIRANRGSLEDIDMSKAYVEMAGIVKGNVYGLGSWGQTLINKGANTSTTSSANQDEFIKNLKDELHQQFRAEMETLKAQMEAQVQSQVQEIMLALFHFGAIPPATCGGSL